MLVQDLQRDANTPTFAVPSPADAGQAGWYRTRGKRVIDVVLASALVVLFMPIMVLVSILISWDGHQPFFIHERVGRFGRRFGCMKFRTMRPDAELELDALLMRDPVKARQWLQVQKLDEDPRITRVGRFLRRTSLDELPQLFNVLRGEMSMVGPRPVTEGELFQYGRHIHKYLALRPGATGLWQVFRRGKVAYGDRVAMDALYHDTVSLRGDLLLCLRTFRVILSQRGQ